jgi:hypothetical protein
MSTIICAHRQATIFSKRWCQQSIICAHNQATIFSKRWRQRLISAYADSICELGACGKGCLPNPMTTFVMHGAEPFGQTARNGSNLSSLQCLSLPWRRTLHSVADTIAILSIGFVEHGPAPLVWSRLLSRLSYWIDGWC